MPYKVVICDDHVMFSDALKDYFHAATDLEVVHTQDNTDNLMQSLHTHKPDLLLTDLMLPGPDIYESLGQVLRKKPEIKILVMSGMFNTGNAKRLHQLGVHGIVSKTGTIDDVVQATQAVLKGQVHYPQAYLEQWQAKKGGDPKISKREAEVMSLIAKGMSEKEIATELGLSESTINNHKANIYQKLGVQNQVSMVVEGIRLGLIQNPAMTS